MIYTACIRRIKYFVTVYGDISYGYGTVGWGPSPSKNGPETAILMSSGPETPAIASKEQKLIHSLSRGDALQVYYGL